VVRWNVTDNLNGLRPFGPVFDLVFMDPPYRRELVQPVLTGLSRAQLLAADGLVVVEHAPEETIDPDAAGMRLEDQRRYGRTRLSFFSAIPSDIASAGIPC
jgi:16S rRNA (guanine966-N2)-methyltransferase